MKAFVLFNVRPRVSLWSARDCWHAYEDDCTYYTVLATSIFIDILVNTDDFIFLFINVKYCLMLGLCFLPTTHFKPTCNCLLNGRGQVLSNRPLYQISWYGNSIDCFAKPVALILINDYTQTSILVDSTQWKLSTLICNILLFQKLAVCANASSCCRVSTAK